MPSLAEWADLLDGAERHEGLRRDLRSILMPDALARQLATDLRAADRVVQALAEDEDEE